MRAFLSLAVLLAGCSVHREGDRLIAHNSDRHFGYTVNGNIATQTVDMNPQYAGVPIEGGSGQRSVEAVRRYMQGNVKELYRSDLRAEVGKQGGADNVATPTTATAPK